MSAVRLELRIECKEAHERVDHHSAEANQENDGQDVEDGSAGSLCYEECDVNDQGCEDGETEGNCDAQLGLDGDTEARSVANFATWSWPSAC